MLEVVDRELSSGFNVVIVKPLLPAEVSPERAIHIALHQASAAASEFLRVPAREPDFALLSWFRM